ncbi:MAG: hypothetical protein R3B54_15610 [Bdellovibrionota bacterium]
MTRTSLSVVVTFTFFLLTSSAYSESRSLSEIRGCIPRAKVTVVSNQPFPKDRIRNIVTYQISAWGCERYELLHQNPTEWSGPMTFNKYGVAKVTKVFSLPPAGFEDRFAVRGFGVDGKYKDITVVAPTVRP